MNWAEWRQEQWKMEKAVARGGTRTPLSTPRSPAYTAAQETWPGGYGQRNAYPGQPANFIEDVDELNFFSPFQPVAPFGPPNVTSPREWDYPVGYNLDFIQRRLQFMSMLRGMRDSWGVLSTIISTRQDQLLRIPWTIQRKDKPKAGSKTVDEIREFFKKPDGKLRYSQWTRLVTDDLLVLDAPCLFIPRNRGGQPMRAERIDPATIFPLIDDMGRRPDARVLRIDDNGREFLQRQPAFQQIIKGMPMTNFDESELIYCPMRPKAEYPMFGYPGTEQIFIEASEAIRKTFYQLNFWAEGTIPDLVVTVPDNWNPRQIAMFQAHFDMMLSGNVQLKSKVRFLPGGMKPFDIKNSSGESLWSQRDETLIRLACYAYSVSPSPFIKSVNRSTAQSAQQSAEQEGLFPLMSFWKDDIIDPIIQEMFGYEDIEFVFLPQPEPDAEKQAKIHQIYAREGIRPRNELRAELGLEPIPGGDVTMIELGNIIVPLETAANGGAVQAIGGGVPESVGAGKPSAGRLPAAAGSQPQRGAARPGRQGANITKLSRAEIEAAGNAAQGDLHAQSHAVLEAGNYPKGHIRLQGLDISIENGKGSVRGKKDSKGIKWQAKMPAHYGYIRGTIGADGDQVDCFIGRFPASDSVWVIDQDRISKKGKNKGFDEHKCMIGYRKLSRAVGDFLEARSDGRGRHILSNVTELSMDEFKSWLRSGDTRAPIAESGYGTVVLSQADLAKLDTISVSTNLSGPARPKKKRKATRGPRWLELSA